MATWVTVGGKASCSILGPVRNLGRGENHAFSSTKLSIEIVSSGPQATISLYDKGYSASHSYHFDLIKLKIVFFDMTFLLGTTK